MRLTVSLVESRAELETAIVHVRVDKIRIEKAANEAGEEAKHFVKHPAIEAEVHVISIDRNHVE